MRLEKRARELIAPNIERCIEAAVGCEPKADGWTALASSLGEAIVERALAMPLAELREFLAATPHGMALAGVSDNTIASAAHLVRAALLPERQAGREERIAALIHIVETAYARHTGA